jgi:dATP pyrophosphohydrolase
MTPVFKQPVSVLVVIHTPQLDVLLMERAKATPCGNRSPAAGKATKASPTPPCAKSPRKPASRCPPTRSRLAPRNRFVIMQRWRGRYAPGVTHNTEHVFSLCVPAIAPVRLAPDEHTAAWLPWREAAEMVSPGPTATPSTSSPAA